MSLYLRCPAQWKRRYVDRVSDPSTAAQATGIAFHKALEALHRGEDGEVAWLVAADSIEAVLAQTSQSLTMSKEHGLKLIGLYRQLGLDAAIGEPERMFKLPVQASKLPVPLLGFIDLTIPSAREFRDFKTTGGSFWTAAKVDLEPQVAVYGWAYQKLYHHRADRARWCIFNTQTVALDVYETVPSPDAFRLFMQTAEMAWERIADGDYAGCGKCPEVCKPRGERVVKGPSFTWEEAIS